MISAASEEAGGTPIDNDCRTLPGEDKMDPEFLELARAAVAALQVARQPTWVEIAELVIYGIGLAAISWHLWDMKKYGQRRDREIDAWAASLRETNRNLTESSQGWAESHQRLDDNTCMLGQLLEQQRQARLHPSH